VNSTKSIFDFVIEFKLTGESFKITNNKIDIYYRKNFKYHLFFNF